MNEEATPKQYELIGKLSRQLSIKPILPPPQTYTEADKEIKRLLNLVNGNHIKKGINEFMNEFDGKYIVPEPNKKVLEVPNKVVKISSDQCCRFYSNIISIIWDKHKSKETNLELIDFVYQHGLGKI